MGDPMLRRPRRLRKDVDVRRLGPMRRGADLSNRRCLRTLGLWPPASNVSSERNRVFDTERRVLPFGRRR